MAHFYSTVEQLAQIKKIQLRVAKLPIVKQQEILNILEEKFSQVGISPTSRFHSTFNTPTFFHKHEPKSLAEFANYLLKLEVPYLDDNRFDLGHFWVNCTFNRDRLWTYLLLTTHKALKSLGVP